MSSWSTEVVRVLWLSAPVVVAALVHIVVIKLDLFAALKRPLDAGLCLGGARLFGDNKTLRGALVMVLVSAAAMPLQGVLRLESLEYFDYGATSLVLAGALFGLGFVLGELPNSFLKRRLGVAPGGRGPLVFVVLDQVDSIVGALLCITPIWVPGARVWIVALVLCSGLHMAVNSIFVLVGLKERVL